MDRRTYLVGGGGSGFATTALDNLASVAINTSLISDTNNTDDLGSSGITWRTGYFGTSVLAPFFAPTSGTLSSAGLVRGTNNSTLIAARNAGNSANITFGTNTSDQLVGSHAIVAPSFTSNSTSAGSITLSEPSGTGSDGVTISAPSSVTSSYTLTLPAAIAAGVVATNGSGTTAFRTISGTSPISVANGDGASGNPTISYTAGGLIVSRPGGITTTLTGWPTGAYFKHEEWTLSGAVCTTAGRTCGEGGHWWLSTGTTASMAGVAGTLEPNHIGMRVVRTGASTNDSGSLEWTASGGSMAWSNNWDAIYVVKPENSDVNTKMRFGLSSDFGADPPPNGVYLEKLAADTNWFLVCRTATVETRTDTSVAHGASWFTFRIRRTDASTIGWTLCSGDACSLGSENTTTTNCPTAATEARAGYFVHTATTATKGLFIDYSDIAITGLSR